MKTVLYTDIIKLSAPEKSDAGDLFYLRTHLAVNKYIKRKIPNNISEVGEFIEQRISDKNDFYFTIKTLTNAKLTGTICLMNISKENKYAEVGFELMPEYQGRGIMTNALSEIINFAFTELNLETIEAFTHKNNLSSRKLLVKFNFKIISGKTDPDNSNNIIYCLKKTIT